MNNNCWGSEKTYQKHFYASRFIGCDIEAALAAGAPAIIEIPIDPDEFPAPAAAVRRPD